jgi:hypothetical protein
VDLETLKWLVPVVITSTLAIIAILTFRATRAKWRKELPDLSVLRFAPKHDIIREQVFLGRDAFGNHFEHRRREEGVIEVRINNAGGTDVTVSTIRISVPTRKSREYSASYGGGRLLARDHEDYRLDFTNEMRGLRKLELEGWDRVATRWRKVTVTLVSADRKERAHEVGWTTRDMIRWAKSTQS